MSGLSLNSPPRAGAPAGAGYWGIDWALGLVAFLGLVLEQRFGSLAILMFLGAYGLLVLRSWREAFSSAVSGLTFLIVPILALLSSLWSEVPSHTLRISVELLVTAMFAFVLVRRLSGAQFAGALFIALGLVCAASAVSGRTISSPDGPTLVGLMGSKNQMGFVAQTFFAVALAVVTDRKQPVLFRLGAVPSLPFASWLVVFSHSAGALISLLFGAGLYLALLFASRLTPFLRVVALISLVAVALPVAIKGPVLLEAAEDYSITHLGKDPTLTGRTYLWQRGREFVAEKPVVGHGYNAFWRRGSLDAEGLWRFGKINSRTGYNFHNLWLEVAVDMGALGVAATILSFLLIGLSLATRLFGTLTAPIALLTTLFAVMLIRSSTESNLFLPWSLYTVLFYAVGAYAAARMIAPRPAFRPAESSLALPDSPLGAAG